MSDFSRLNGGPPSMGTSDMGTDGNLSGPGGKKKKKKRRHRYTLIDTFVTISHHVNSFN